MACARRDATRREAPCNRNRARDRPARAIADGATKRSKPRSSMLSISMFVHPRIRGIAVVFFRSDIHSAIHDGAHHSGCYFCHPIEGSLNRARFVDVESNPRAGSGLAGS